MTGTQKNRGEDPNRNPGQNMPPPVYRPAPVASQKKAAAPPAPASLAAPAVYRPVPRAAIAGPPVYRPNIAAPLQPKQRLTAPSVYRPQLPVQMARAGGANLRAQYGAAILVIIANILAGQAPLDNVDDLLNAPAGVADQVVGLARADIEKQQQAKALRAQKQQRRNEQKQLRRQFRGNSKFR